MTLASKIVHTVGLVWGVQHPNEVLDLDVEKHGDPATVCTSFDARVTKYCINIVFVYLIYIYIYYA